MAKATKPKRPDPATMTFEETTAELESIIERVEKGEIGLEEALAERRRGEALIARSRAILDAAEQELEQIRAGDRGAATGPEPAEPEAEPAAE
jgi:exodeoxyribonuclease VII small subunit